MTYFAAVGWTFRCPVCVAAGKLVRFEADMSNDEDDENDDVRLPV